MTDSPVTAAEQAAAVLRGMAEHGIRIDDRAFERFTTTLLAEYDRRGAEIEQLRADLDQETSTGCMWAIRAGAAEAERDQLRQQRDAALDLIDEWERLMPAGMGTVSMIRQMVDVLGAPQTGRAALGAADEPTTGGGSDA